MNNRSTLRTRPPWERIRQIHDRIQGGSYPNCVGLAAELEASLATLKRDVQFMKDRLALPIEYDARRHGYSYTGPVNLLPGLGQTVTEAELFALLAADKAVAQYRGTPFQAPLHSAFKKLAPQLEPHQQDCLNRLESSLSFRPLGAEETVRQDFLVVAEGLRQRRTLKFRYRNLGARFAQARRARPYHLTCIDNHWYLFAHDLRRRALRTFALARLTAPVLTTERFNLPLDFDPDQYLRGSFTVLKGGEDYEVVLEFDPWATDLVRSRLWHPGQQLLALPGGASQLRLRLSALDEIERWVLSWGLHATVIRPRALLERVAKIARQIADRADHLLAEPPSEDRFDSASVKQTQPPHQTTKDCPKTR